MRDPTISTLLPQIQSKETTPLLDQLSLNSNEGYRNDTMLDTRVELLLNDFIQAELEIEYICRQYSAWANEEGVAMPGLTVLFDGLAKEHLLCANEIASFTKKRLLNTKLRSISPNHHIEVARGQNDNVSSKVSSDTLLWMLETQYLAKLKSTNLSYWLIISDKQSPLNVDRITRHFILRKLSQKRTSEIYRISKIITQLKLITGCENDAYTNLLGLYLWDRNLAG